MAWGGDRRGRVAKVKALGVIARDLGCTTAQLSLAWCLKNPNVSSAITGATTGEQVRENMASLDVLEKLNADVMDRIDNVLQNKPESPRDFR
jgi:aryl-alcohol dehydrogenase-like predicted oxidoreductase